jgi:hypothetical protein
MQRRRFEEGFYHISNAAELRSRPFPGTYRPIGDVADHSCSCLGESHPSMVTCDLSLHATTQTGSFRCRLFLDPVPCNSSENLRKLAKASFLCVNSICWRSALNQWISSSSDPETCESKSSISELRLSFCIRSWSISRCTDSGVSKGFLRGPHAPYRSRGWAPDTFRPGLRIVPTHTGN